MMNLKVHESNFTESVQERYPNHLIPIENSDLTENQAEIEEDIYDYTFQNYQGVSDYYQGYQQSLEQSINQKIFNNTVDYLTPEDEIQQHTPNIPSMDNMFPQDCYGENIQENQQESLIDYKFSEENLKKEYKEVKSEHDDQNAFHQTNLQFHYENQMFPLKEEGQVLYSGQKEKGSKIKKEQYTLDNLSVNKLKNFYKTFMNRIRKILVIKYKQSSEMLELIHMICHESNQRNFLDLFPHLKQVVSKEDYLKNEKYTDEQFRNLLVLRKEVYKIFGQHFHQMVRVIKGSISFKQKEEFIYGCLFYADRSSKVFPCEMEKQEQPSIPFSFDFVDSDFDQRLKKLDSYEINANQSNPQNTRFGEEFLIEKQQNLPETHSFPTVSQVSCQGSSTPSKRKSRKPYQKRQLK